MKIKKEKLIVVIFFIIVSLFLASIIFTKEYESLDEIWQYSMAKNVCEGKIPYRDFNMIVTPALPMISAIFLKIFGNQLIVMRCINVLLQLGILIITFLIFKKLKINTYVSLLFVLSLIYLNKSQMTLDYNYLVLFILLIIIYLELKKNKALDENNLIETKLKKHNLIVGVLAGLTICTKQTTGIFISLALLVYELILVKNTKELKQVVKNVLYKIIGIFIPIIVLAIYFTVTNSWTDFVSYCILGIKDFSNNIPYMELLKNERLIIKILTILNPMILIYMLFVYFKTRTKRSEYNYNLFTMIPFAIAEIIVVYPISDENHFLIAMYPTTISLLYIIYEIVKNIIRKFSKEKLQIFIKNFIEIFFIILMVYILLSNILPTLYEYIFDTYTSKLNHYKYIPINEGLEKRIEEVSEYIEQQNKPVYILDAEAAIYKTVIDKYDKNYDLFLKGNLGKNGEEGIIKEIEQNKNKDIIYLIRERGQSRNWQSPEEVIKYAFNNFTVLDKISYYDVYENK